MIFGGDHGNRPSWRWRGVEAKTTIVVGEGLPCKSILMKLMMYCLSLVNTNIEVQDMLELILIYPILPK